MRISRVYSHRPGLTVGPGRWFGVRLEREVKLTDGKRVAAAVDLAARGEVGVVDNGDVETTLSATSGGFFVAGAAARVLDGIARVGGVLDGDARVGGARDGGVRHDPRSSKGKKARDEHEDGDELHVERRQDRGTVCCSGMN